MPIVADGDVCFDRIQLSASIIEEISEEQLSLE
jgi:hypothetical protein